MLPAEWRIPTWKFWSFWSDVAPGQLALCARLQDWIDRGLTLDDARQVFAQMNDPDEADRIESRWVFLAALTAKVKLILKRRRTEREAAERRTQAPAVAAILRRIGTDPTP
jgi:hypothetical protein